MTTKQRETTTNVVQIMVAADVTGSAQHLIGIMNVARASRSTKARRFAATREILMDGAMTSDMGEVGELTRTLKSNLVTSYSYYPLVTGSSATLLISRM